MGWLIAVLIIIWVAASSNKKENTSAAGNAKNRQGVLKTQNKINKYIALMQTRPASPAVLSQVDEAVDDLMDEYLYYWRKTPPEERECAAIMDAFDRYPWSYRGKKYARCSGQLVEDALRDLRDNMR